MSTVLVIEDTSEVRHDIVEILSFEGYDVVGAADGVSGVRLARERRPDLVICDIMMPELDGYGVLEELRRGSSTSTIPFIFLTAKSAREDMRKGMVMGADDYITKPFTADELIDAVRARIEQRETLTSRLLDELRSDRPETALQETGAEGAQEPPVGQKFDRIIGASDQMQAIFSVLHTVANVDVPVLILGETGTGKELVARALHDTGGRKGKTFISVNCATLPAEMVESELFGHEKGAFTGALQQRIGKVELAEGGTLFLDEIAEMHVGLQAKLLRFLEEHTFERIGGTRPLRADVRVLAATNRDIEQAIRDNVLRMDLVYRLNTITISLPPLRERREDIPLLVNHFIEEANKRYGCAIRGVDPKVYAELGTHHWPGNVRELKNVIDRAAILTKTGRITLDSIQLSPVDSSSVGKEVPKPSLSPQTDRPLMELKRELVEQFERSYIDRLLRQFGGNVTRSARAARIGKKNFIMKMRQYNINRQDYLDRAE